MLNDLTRPLRNYAARPLVRNVAKVGIGNVAGGALNWLALALLSDKLAPADRGLFVALQTAMILLATLSDFGLNTTIIKYYRELANQGREEAAEALLRWSLWLRIALVGTLVAGCIAAAGPICRDWLGRPEAVGLFRVVCVGALGSSIWLFAQAAMQARERFGWYAGLTTANHALRLGLFAALVATGRLTVAAAVVIMAVIPFVGSLGALITWPRRFWSARMERPELRRRAVEIFHFSKWIFLSTITCAVIMQLDVMLLTALSTEAEVGQFGNARDLSLGFILLASAVSTVLLPRLSATRRRDDMLRIFGYMKWASLWLALLVGGAIGAGHLLIPYLHDGAYVPSIVVFDLLVVSFAITIIVNPLSFFCLAFGRARWLLWMNLAQLGINAGVDFVLIPKLGALAGGISTLLVFLFALVYLAVAFKKLLGMAEE